MKKINIPYFSLRLLTVFSYFLPFVFFLSTCTDDLNGKEAYNKEDAITNEKRENEIKIGKITSFIAAFDTITVNKDAAATELIERINIEFNNTDNVRNLSETVETKIYFPTNYSLSAIGIIVLHKDLLGKILIAISIFISLITLLFWVIIDKKRIAIYLFAANISAITIFIIDCFFSNVTVLMGTWTLLFMLFVQLMTEIQTRRKASH